MQHIIHNPYDGKPITDENVENYILTNELNYHEVKLKDYKQLQFPMLLQNDFGVKDNCTVSSMTACIKYFYPNFLEPNQNIHDTIWAIYKRHWPRFSKSHTGVVPFVNAKLYKDAYYYYNLPYYRPIIKYGYRLGFNYFTIKRQINADNPVILSMQSDGRKCYKNHTVVVIGYAEYTVKSHSIEMLFPEKTKRMLIVADNCSKNIRYLDPSCLSMISCICY